MVSRPHRWWLFRGLACLLALVPFLLAELTCVLLGWGATDLNRDPFVGFEGSRPLFVLDEVGDHYEIAPNRRSFFAYDSFSATKGPNTRRIFCLGGSTVQGRPYSIETSFPTCMRLALQQADPETNWEVVNCGGISYASYRLVPILDEVLRHQPDLILLCTGHNEFLEDRSYPVLRRSPSWSLSGINWLLQRRLVRIGAGWWRGIMADQTPGQGPQTDATGAPVLPTEVATRLDFQRGLDAYHRDPAWHAGVREHFEFNVRRMIQLCRVADVPIVVLLPPSNLSGQPPFKSEPSPGQSPAAQLLVNELLASARESEGVGLKRPIELLRKACVNDPDDARLWYQLGRLELLASDVAAARACFTTARDLDICPLRMTSPLEETLRQIADEESVPFVDLHQLLEQETASGILGDEWLVDHVHPNFDGHRRIGIALVELLIAQRFVTPGTDAWQQRSRAAFTAHFEQLDRAYFHRGQRMLENLRGWAAGQATDLPPSVETDEGGS
ncbi:MAG: hypothetical protein KDA58_02345 [Planctomycetaceae bacterium]|nr:hypothetical protein [Planctomycetaceae bacterium]